ncbi:unnamed protein product [Thlaspi arvense]|uniref:Uncharacterized protein n=1 Tax=Thlaspi arvense TaxID=13288 RepID=A0AAU9T3A7_THLAR|nr:unnamed protein product [Thlaspi arvense]
MSSVQRPEKQRDRFLQQTKRSSHSAVSAPYTLPQSGGTVNAITCPIGTTMVCTTLQCGDPGSV